MNEISIIIPVYNEAENIRDAVERIEREVPLQHTFLIVYDTDEDNTLPAARELQAEYPNIRLVRNAYGRGALNAIKTGLEAAETAYAVVTMADLSDPPAVINAMYETAEAEGADIVCASRYMKGGKQTGGPVVKGLLSRMAGLSLHWLAKLPTHDATNSFKLYRVSFLRRQTIESAGGFELGLELTAKAYVSGAKICEVPTSWTDRNAGKSNFKLLEWLPGDLNWYFYAFSTPHAGIMRYFPALFKYFFAGTVCALLNWVVFYLCNYTAGMNYIPAAVVAFFVAASVSFLFSTKIFKSKKNKRGAEYALVIGSSVAALLLDLALMTALINLLVCSAMLAKIAGTFVEFVFNFCIRQFFIFDHTR
jgi:glycosyltransferase involved in cell wall biosynthesis